MGKQTQLGSASIVKCRPEIQFRNIPFWKGWQTGEQNNTSKARERQLEISYPILPPDRALEKALLEKKLSFSIFVYMSVRGEQVSP